MKELNVIETKDIRGGFVALGLFIVGAVTLGGIAWGTLNKS